MRRFSLSSSLILCVWVSWFNLVPASQVWSQEFNVAFYYGDQAPLDELRAFDVVVVEPDHQHDPNSYRTDLSEMFAYVSVGEFSSTRHYAKAIPDQWVAGENTAWEARVIDQSQEQWPAFVVEHIIGPLWKEGYRGFFLDTLDSYHLVATTSDAQRKQEAGLIRVIRQIRQTYPEAKLIFNRGFEIIPKVADHVYAVAAESLFHGWDQANRRYVKVGEDDREWLLARLQAIQQTYHLPIIVIDYVEPEARGRAREVAQAIADLHMIPWVSTPELDLVGVGAIEVMPRKIFSIFDGGQDPDPGHSDFHRYVDFPLNHLGYMAEHWNIHVPLPAYPLRGRYAGIVVWGGGKEHPWNHAFYEWVRRQIRHGLPVVFLDHGSFPTQAELLDPLQLEHEALKRPVSRVQFSKVDPRIGYEIQPIAKRRQFHALTVKLGQPLLQLESNQGQHQDAVAVTPWGGYALFPYAVMHLPGLEQARWLFDPIEFLQEALRLKPMPIPDTTTENGRRLLLIHIDGDGFASLAEFPGGLYAGEVMLDDVLRKYRVPTTVSVIEGEVGAKGLYPKLTKRFEKAARSIFALSHVELASHSYSHPFFWRDFIALGSTQPGKYHLPVPRYSYSPNSYRREIKGSIDYINTRLAPPDKKVRVFLWTGDCDPPSAALAEAYAIQVGNMNGGDTVMTEDNKSLTAVAAFGIQKGRHFQIYAPNQNENIYTNEWTGPFYGFDRVIETFQLTERPRRLKPINIYYHTYSASKKSALNALHRVYEWALQQETNPIYVSEYIRKVQDFNRMVVARRGTTWKVRGLRDLRELRVPQAMGFPNFQTSVGVAGFSEHGADRYVHIGDQLEVTVQFVSTAPKNAYLRESNGRLLSWSKSGQTVRFTLKGHQPLFVSVDNVKKCRVTSHVGHVENRQEGKRSTIFVKKQREKPISFTCTAAIRS